MRSPKQAPSQKLRRSQSCSCLSDLLPSPGRCALLPEAKGAEGEAHTSHAAAEEGSEQQQEEAAWQAVKERALTERQRSDTASAFGLVGDALDEMMQHVSCLCVCVCVEGNKQKQADCLRMV